MDTEYTIQIYSTETGEEPFSEWLDSLEDMDAKALVFQRLQRIRLGNFGDCKPLDDGV
jgi:putative addiction module killer protein